MEAFHRPAKFVPERALLGEEVAQVVEAVGEIEQIVFSFKETLKEFEGIGLCQHLGEHRRIRVDDRFAGIIAGISQWLELKE